jgi:pyruvate/2-oxoglutarate dehydrogenase complex dihydrolipoamide acyltransferase (E2) component
LKQPGERIARDEHIYEMETDKANVEVESPYAGVLVEWLAKEGDILPIGAPIARMEVEGAVEVAPPVAHAPAAPAPSPAAPVREPVAVGARLELVIPPRTRAYARQKGVSEEELRRIPAASGNKLMPEDIDAYLAGRAGDGAAEYVDYLYLPSQAQHAAGRARHLTPTRALGRHPARRGATQVRPERARAAV